MACRCVPIEAVGERELNLLFLARPGDESPIGGLRTLVRLLREARLPVIFTPGVIHLPTVPAHRKVNRVDLGTADKVCAAAAAIEEQGRRLDIPYAETSFVLAELGGAFTAVLSVEGGRIVGGQGGSSGPLGYLACGALDGEVACLLGGVSKETVFSGGVAFVAGSPDATPEALASRQDEASALAREAFVESLVKAVAGELAAVAAPREILLSGRLSRIPGFREPVVTALSRLGPVRCLDVGTDGEGGGPRRRPDRGRPGGRPLPGAGRSDASQGGAGHGPRPAVPDGRRRGAQVGAVPGSVLIVGVSTRALAESASRAGYACVTVDAFGDLDQKSRAQNVALARDLGRRYSAAAAVAVGRRFPGAPPRPRPTWATSRTTRRPSDGWPWDAGSWATRRRPWSAPGIPSRSRRSCGEREGGCLGRCCRIRPDRPRPECGWLRKPRRGGGGSGVREWKPGAPLRPHELVQERIEGVLASAAFVADGRRAVLLGMSKGLAGDPAFGATGVPVLRQRLSLLRRTAPCSTG